jgi:DNA-directed DNA polymerase III PolC
VTDFANFPTCHSHPSSFDSGSTPEAMVKRELELGTGAVTMTDHGTLQSARLVYRLARKKGLRPILGLEAYFRDDDCPILAADGIVKQPESMKPDARQTVAHYLKYQHLTMHALDQEGFETIVRVLSAANEHPERHGIESKPIFTWRDMEELGSKNITFGSGCLIGMVQRHLLNDKPKLALAYYERMRSMVKPGNFYVELFPHDCSRNWVNAVFVSFRASETTGVIEDERKYHNGKWLRIRYDGGVKELRANELVEMWDKWLEGKGAMPKVELLAVKHYQTWEEEPEPLVLDGAKAVEDFVQNECRPWCPDGDVQRGANRFLIALAKKFNDPILISDDSHFAFPDEKVVQDVRLFSMENDKTKGNTAKWRFYGSYHRKTSAEVWGHFQKTLGIDEDTMHQWVQNSIDWSKRFGWEFKDRKSLPTKFYPTDTLKHTMDIVKRVGRMDWSSKERRDRLAAEIKMLHKNGTIDLLPYFFIDHEVCERYEQHGELTGTGRGSAAGLSLAYYMGITHIDPLKYGLSKERFLTESRIRSGKLPDIDQDLPSHDLLYDAENPQKGWLMERFAGHVARISTNGTLRLRSTVQDVSRVMHGSVLPEVFNLTKKFPKVPQGIKDYDFVFGYLDADRNPVKGAIETDPVLQEYKRKFPKEWDIVVKALGITRQKSQHACAFVMTNEPIANFIPTMVLSDGTRVTEYVNSAEDPAVEDAGGVKMDFLQLKTLRDIQGALKLIQQRTGYQPKDERIGGLRVPGIRVVPFLRNDGVLDLYDVWDLPEDQAVFADICRGDTVTVFQFGTPGARQWMENFYNKARSEHALKSIEHIAAFTALDRPGPLDYSVSDGEVTRNMLEEFAARSRGEKAIGTMKVLMDTLPETHGVITYQEQLQHIFVKVGQTTAEQGDEFRVHVSKKKMDAVLKDKAVFMPGATKSIGEPEANRLWAMLETFGQYGFNKSHSVCYAATGYVCAWLKHHYPLEWWTSCLRNADRKTVDQKFWVHCRRYIRIPDVRLSQDDFAIEGDAIRAPLRLLTGVGDKAHEELVAGRPYKDIRDFVQRIYDRKVSTGTRVKKVVKKRILKRDQVEGGPTHTEAEVEELKLGRSSINKTVLLKLIVSGAADSLFPPEAKSVFEKLNLFAENWADVHGLRRRDGSLKVEQVDPRFGDLTGLQQFLLKKSVLPSYAADLGRLVATVRDDVVDDGGRYAWRSPRAFEGNYFIPLVDGDVAKGIMEGQTPGDFDFPDRFKFGVVAYVNEVEWFWNGQAARVRFEVDGERLDSVMWPRRSEDPDTGEKKQLPPKLPDDLKGSVAVLTMVRWSAGKSFSLDDIIVVEKPFSLKAEEE